MNDESEHTGTTTDAQAPDSRSARRQFIKRSGGLAIAAPAVVLLLSAAEKASAKADPYNKGPSTSPWDPGKKNLLDPP